MTELSDRIDARQKALRERLQAARDAASRDPKPLPKYMAESIVAGKTVREWSVLIDKLVETEVDAARQEPEVISPTSDEPPRRRLVVIDLTMRFPPEASVAVTRWRRAGSPTEADEFLATVQALRDEAEKYTNFASLERDRARDAEKAGDKKRAEQHRRYETTNREKAERFFADIEAAQTAWKKAHP